MKRFIYSIAIILSLMLITAACDESNPTQEAEPTVDFQFLSGYWVLNNYETHTYSNNNTIVLNTPLDGSMGIDFAADGALKILQHNTLQATGSYTIHDNLNKIELSELILEEGVEPEGTAKLIYPIISGNTVEVRELTNSIMAIVITYDKGTDMVAYFSKK